MKKAVMTRAWEIYRTLTGDRRTKLSMALRRAWAEIKAANEKKEFGDHEVIVIEGMSRNQVWSFNRWEKYGKRRIYINESKWGKIGYIDIDTKEYCGNRHDAYMSVINSFLASYNF
mgnify:CR=1 FL=1